MNIRLPHGDDIILGTSAPPFPIPRFRLSREDQGYHATIWGRTGSGKSKLLQSVFLQHVKKKHGVGLIEPHHDLSYDTLVYFTKHGFFRNSAAFDRLVYIDWGNGAYAPFNILADDGKTDDHTRALNALEGMLRVFPELSEAPMFQTLFLVCAMCLQAAKRPITFTYQLLTDIEFRNACLSKVSDPLIGQTFAWFDKLGRDQASLAGSLVRRAFLLSFSPYARNTLGQPDNWLNFRKWLDEGRSFIINLGNINDGETRKLIGAMLMVQIEQAALSRTDIPPARRTPCTLLVDEWPSFAAQEKTISTVLSQTRKFGLRLWLAAQSLSQISSERLTGAIENCRLTIAFGLGRDSAEIQAKNIGKADPFAIKEEPLTTTQHGQYLSIMEQFESWTQELQNLSPRVAYVKLHNKPAAKIRTLNVSDAKIDPLKLNAVLAEYRRRYQRTKEEAEAAIAGISSPEHASSGSAPTGDEGKQQSFGRWPAYTKLFGQRGATMEDDPQSR